MKFTKIPKNLEMVTDQNKGKHKNNGVLRKKKQKLISENEDN